MNDPITTTELLLFLLIMIGIPCATFLVIAWMWFQGRKDR